MTHSKKTQAAPLMLLSAALVLSGCVVEGLPESEGEEYLGEQEYVLIDAAPSDEAPVHQGGLTPPIDFAYPTAGPLGDEVSFDGVIDAQEMMTDEAVPSLMEDAIAYVYVAGSCKTDKDCAPDAWCGKNIDGDAVCHAYVGEGEICGGYMPMGMAPKCGPNLECVFDSPYPDFPGICEAVL